MGNSAHRDMAWVVLRLTTDNDDLITQSIKGGRYREVSLGANALRNLGRSIALLVLTAVMGCH